MSRNIAFCVLSLLTGFYFCGQSQALMLEMSLEDLTADSEFIVVGKVEHVKGHKSKDGKGIYTVARLKVEDVVKDDIPEDTIDIEYEGGVLWEEGVFVINSNVAPLEKGEKVLLFLTYEESQVYDRNTYYMTHYSLGKFRIDNEGIIRSGGFTMENGKRKDFGYQTVEEMKDKIYGILSE